MGMMSTFHDCPSILAISVCPNPHLVVRTSSAGPSSKGKYPSSIASTQKHDHPPKGSSHRFIIKYYRGTRILSKISPDSVATARVEPRRNIILYLIPADTLWLYMNRQFTHAHTHKRVAWAELYLHNM